MKFFYLFQVLKGQAQGSLSIQYLTAKDQNMTVKLFWQHCADQLVHLLRKRQGRRGKLLDNEAKNYHGKKSKHANHPRLNQLLCAAGLTFLIKNLSWVQITIKFFIKAFISQENNFFEITEWGNYLNTANFHGLIFENICEAIYWGILFEELW